MAKYLKREGNKEGKKEIKNSNKGFEVFQYLALVVLLPLVCERRPNDLPCILDHHLPGINIAFAEKAPPMDFGAVHINSLLGKSLQFTEPHSHWEAKASGSTGERQTNNMIFFL